MSYEPDCADCPTPDECKAANDCKVLRQIRHGNRATPSAEAPIKPPTVNDLLTLLDDFAGIVGSYENSPDSSAVARDEHECRKKIMALFMAAQEATYPGVVPSASVALTPDTHLVIAPHHPDTTVRRFYRDWLRIMQDTGHRTCEEDTYLAGYRKANEVEFEHMKNMRAIGPTATEGQ